jgi:hypothetical protein
MGCGWDVAEIFILERFHLLPRNIIKWRFPKSCRYPKSSKSWMTIETYWNPWWPLWLGYSIQHFKKAPYAGISHLICGLGILLRHFETIFIHSMVFEWSSSFFSPRFMHMNIKNTYKANGFMMFHEFPLQHTHTYIYTIKPGMYRIS